MKSPTTSTPFRSTVTLCASLLGLVAGMAISEKSHADPFADSPLIQRPRVLEPDPSVMGKRLVIDERVGKNTNKTGDCAECIAPNSELITKALAPIHALNPSGKAESAENPTSPSAEHSNEQKTVPKATIVITETPVLLFKEDKKPPESKDDPFLREESIIVIEKEF